MAGLEPRRPLAVEAPNRPLTHVGVRSSPCAHGAGQLVHDWRRPGGKNLSTRIALPAFGLDRAGAGGLGDSRAGRVAVVLDRVGHALRFGIDTGTARAFTLETEISVSSVNRFVPHFNFGSLAATIGRCPILRFRRLMLALRTKSASVGVVVQVADRRLDAQLLTRTVAVAPVNHVPAPVLVRAARNN